MGKRMCPILAALLLSVGVAAAGSGGFLRRGDRGGMVVLLQEWLARTGVYAGAPTGCFAAATESAVRRFQSVHGLRVDGIVGPVTWNALGQRVLRATAPLSSRGPAAPLAAWETVNRFWPPGRTATLHDPDSRTSVRVKRLGGRLHADIEPLSAADARVLRTWFNGWSWKRHAVIFRADRLLCGASINGMPHGRDSVQNGMPGHICLHFLGSRVHRTGRMDAEHQRLVMRAAQYLLGAGGRENGADAPAPVGGAAVSSSGVAARGGGIAAD
ncbi:MAG: peptidoglycan-binding domain-containing protein [Bacteroidota bacterium]